MSCDLHCHSFYSDGTDSPAALVQMAERLGLSTLALTDHNTTAGLAGFLQAGVGSAVHLIPGIELSLDWEGTEVHVLGFFLNARCIAELKPRMLLQAKKRHERNCRYAEKLTAAGYPISIEELYERYPHGNLNRSHFADILIDKGFAADRKEAYATFISKEHPCYVPNNNPDALEYIRLLRSFGAVPVLAHIFLNLKTAEKRAGFLSEGKAAGLIGMETIYSEYTPAQQKEAEELANFYGLLPSGGSDYHGTAKPGIYMGCGRGNLCVPDTFPSVLYGSLLE